MKLSESTFRIEPQCNYESVIRNTLGGLHIRHSGLDPESRISFWIPAFAGMTTLVYAIIFATFR